MMEHLQTQQKRPLAPAQQRQKKLRAKAWERAAIQLFFFLGMPGVFVAAFSGAKHLAQWVGSGQPLQWDSFVAALAAVCLFTLVFGRYFCGFVCAFGSLGDLVYALSALVQKKLLRRSRPFRLPERAAAWGQKLKYLVLALILALCALGVYGSLSGTSPWDVFAQLAVLRLPGAAYLAGFGALGAILVGMALHPRFFCQFLCPLGAIFALLPVPLGARLRRSAPDCIRGCQACRMNCPVGIKLQEDDRDGECIACEKCVGACPKQNISRWDLRLLPSPLLPPVLKAALFAALGLWLGLARF